ncbi:MAG TPA: hypothetical protein VJ044_15140, partial [Candidatus Hodarchaeales archaeon]|nr:hypothetical protein [Candidatus Hodarchaeales archaeon]
IPYATTIVIAKNSPTPRSLDDIGDIRPIIVTNRAAITIPGIKPNPNGGSSGRECAIGSQLTAIRSQYFRVRGSSNPTEKSKKYRVIVPNL